MKPLFENDLSSYRKGWNQPQAVLRYAEVPKCRSAGCSDGLGVVGGNREESLLVFYTFHFRKMNFILLPFITGSENLRMNLFYWHSDSESHTDRTNYPLFQSYEDIDPETEDSCGSAAINCLTQASHGRKFAHEKGPMLYNAINPTGGAVGVATTAARVFLGIASMGMSEAIISPTLHAIFSESKPILKESLLIQ